MRFSLRTLLIVATLVAVALGVVCMLREVEGGRMRFRKLRIAWSVGCGIVCVLLIVLWVRSYFHSEGLLHTSQAR